MKNSESLRELILEVPYLEKDDAKNLGAKWDPEIRKWFVPKGQDTKPFRRWFQKANDEQYLSQADEG